MNTLFAYMYRDASNYKFSKEVILEGELTFDEIYTYLLYYEYFIPSVVGLENLHPDTLTIDDHKWHEINEIQSTDKPPNSAVNAKILKYNFFNAFVEKWRGDEESRERAFRE